MGLFGRWSPIRVVLLVALLFGAIRVLLILNFDGMWGVAGGAYLLSRNAVLGDEPTGADFSRPPLAPGWLMVLPTTLFGDTAGLSIFAFVASFATLPGFFLLARDALPRWGVVLSSFFLLSDWAFSEMFAAGNLPMIAFGLLLFVFWGIWRLSFFPRQGRWLPKPAPALAIMVCIPLIAVVNQTTTGISVYLVPVFVLATYTTVKRENWPAYSASLLIPLAVGLFLALGALPFYLNVAPGADIVRYPGPLLSVYGLADAAWWQVLAGVPIALFALWRGTPLIRILAILLLACTAITPLLSWDESLMNIFYRTRYLQMIPLYICGTWLAWQGFLYLTNWRWLIKIYVALFCVAMVAGHIFMVHAESNLSRIVTYDTRAALEWINRQPRNGAVITNSYSLALYTAALTKRPVSWTQMADPPKAFVERHEAVVCILNWSPDCDVRAAIATVNAEYVLAERVWPVYGEDIQRTIPGLGAIYSAVEAIAPHDDSYLNQIFGAPDDPWPITDAAPWLSPVWERGTTIVWRISR